LLVPGDAWFAIGPAVVLAAVPAQSLSALNGFVIAAARLAQMLVEIGAWATRERLLGLESLREQLGQLWVNGVDLAFTPVALVIALVVEQRPWAALALLPLLGVLAVFSRERRGRMESLTELNQAYRGTALVLVTSSRPTTATPASTRAAWSR
jgi:hypothetical protein